MSRMDLDSTASYSSDDDLRGLVGLQNLGNTCYMNGALQALSNCQQLTRFVLDCPGFIRDSGLSRSYSELIREIWDTGNSQYAAPTSIIRHIRCIYPAFRGCSQQDTQEFLRCFLEQLHDELKQPPGSRSSKSSPTLSANTNLSDSQKSIISDIFEFKISSSVVCSNCNNISTTKETFKDLSIPIPSMDHPYYRDLASISSEQQSESEFSSTSTIASSISDEHTSCDQSASCKPNQIETNHSGGDEETSNPISKDDGEHDQRAIQELSKPSYLDSIPLARWFINWFSLLGNWFWGPQVTLHDCLSIFFGTDPLEGDNEYSCEVCTKKNRGVKYLKIMNLPEVLCIHFKRYESIGSAKITTHVSFPLTGLDLAPFMSEESNVQCTTYNLIACICHHGSALLNGHYTTYALNCYDDQWYEYDDQYVTNVPSCQVENSEAYILFYQKSTLDNKIERQRVKASKLLRKSLSQEDELEKFFISKQWVNKFNTFVEPGPITNHDFLCKHEKVPVGLESSVGELCHPIGKSVWNYLKKLHGGGPECCQLLTCEICE